MVEKEEGCCFVRVEVQGDAFAFVSELVDLISFFNILLESSIFRITAF